jgi:FSR family fosmidomycin resistance protein-like MFS transporter
MEVSSSNLKSGHQSVMMVQHGRHLRGRDTSGCEETSMNKQAIALLSLGHFLIDFCQGVVPALVPFLVIERHFSYAMAASLVFAISVTSSIVQPLFGQLADRVGVWWLLPGSILVAGVSLALGTQAQSYPMVLAAVGLSGLGVAAFHPEAARRAHLASGDRRTTGMSYFSVGGGLGFALAPVVTTAVAVSWGMRGLVGLIAPTGFVAFLIARSMSAADKPSHSSGGAPSFAGDDDWRGFGILSGATVCRSIVFYGLNTFLALYFMTRWGQTAAEGNRALAVFLGTSIAGTLTGGYLADRLGRRKVLRIGFAGGVVFLALFLATANRDVALLLLIPLAVFLFMPTSVLVVLGQEYLPRRVGMASGVTLGLAVSVGGTCAPLLGRLADRHGLETVIFLLLAVMIVAACQTLALPQPGRHDRVSTELTTTAVEVEAVASSQ